MGRTLGCIAIGLVAGWAASAPAQELDVPEEVAQRLWQTCTDHPKTNIDPGDTEAMITCMMGLVSAAPVSDAVGFYLDGPSSDLFDKVFDLELGGYGEIFSASSLNLYSNDSVYIDLDNDDNGFNSFRILGGDDIALCTVDEDADLICAGTKSALVHTDNFGQRKLYAIEGTQNWFEDIGTARLTGGTATVEIDPIYAETVSLAEYQVFLTPVGGWAELYVADQGRSSFTVARADAGSDIAFHYRIVGQRRGFEGVRLEAESASGDRWAGSESRLSPKSSPAARR